MHRGQMSKSNRDQLKQILTQNPRMSNKQIADMFETETGRKINKSTADYYRNQLIRQHDRGGNMSNVAEDPEISVASATEAMMSAAYLADPCSILKCEDKQPDSFVVVMHNAAWNHEPGRLQRFRVTVTPEPPTEH